MAVCSKCGANLPDNINFCIACGAAVNSARPVKKCAACSGKNPMDHKFCKYCGKVLNNFNAQNICSNCSKENPKNVSYCIFCGASLKNKPVNNIYTNTSSGIPANNIPGSRAAYNSPKAPQNNTIPYYGKRSLGYGKTNKKSAWLKASGIIAGALLVCLIAFIFRGSILSLFGGSTDSTAAEANPAPMPLSGSKAFKVSPAPGLTVSAEENALDKDREFTAYRLDDQELYNAVNKIPYGDMVVIDGYEVNAGLGPEEFFPGQVQLEFDLDNLDIPKSMRKYMGAVRIGEDGQTEILSSTLEGSKLLCSTNKNSVIVTTLLLGGLAAVSGYFVYDDLGEKNLWKFDQYKGKKFYKTTLLPGYHIYWPEGMNFHNSDEVNKKVKEFNKIFAKYKIPTDKDIAEDIIRSLKNENYKKYRESVRTILGSVFNDKDFIKLFDEVSKIEWQKKNVWPTEVQVSIEALENADKYLFGVRKFRRPGHIIDVGILPKWPYDNKDVVGYSFNPKLGSPYIHINAEYPGIPWMKEHLENTKIKERYQPGLDALNVTIAHELFHVVQSGYMPVDWSSYTWFWEASAVLLENEVSKYYLDKDIIKNVDSMTDRYYYETLINTMGYGKLWTKMEGNQKLLRHQAYTSSWFLEFLRDRYYYRKKDDFLKNIIIRFMYQKDYVKALMGQTSNSEMVFLADFKLFCAENGAKFRTRISDVAKNSKSEFFGLTIGSYYRLDEKKPYIEVETEYNPLSTNIKFLDINYDDTKFREKDVCLVFKKSDDTMQNNGEMAVRFDQNQGKDFKSVGQDKWFKFENIKNLSGNIQEIHSYRSLSGNNPEKKYQVFMMVKPSKPKVEKKDNKLIITMPKESPLFGAGYVDKYLVTIKDPKEQTIMMETHEKTIELELNNNGDFTDWGSLEMKKVISEAARKYIDSNPALKKELYDNYGKEAADKGIDSAGELDIDYGVLMRAAEVLNGAIAGEGAKKKYTVTISEITSNEKPIYGPVSDLAELEVEEGSTAGVNIYGTWEGKVQITNQTVTAVIEQGKDGYDYTLKLSMYEDMEFYGDDNGDGTCSFGKDQGFGFTIIKNSENELYMTAPPITLRRK